MFDPVDPRAPAMIAASALSASRRRKARMRALGNESHGPLPRMRSVQQQHLDMRLAIDAADLFARPQIRKHALGLISRDTEGAALADAAAIEAEDETGAHVGAAIIARDDAEAAMPAVKTRGRAGDKGKVRPPHQRAVAEHPEFARDPLASRLVRPRPAAPAAFALSSCAARNRASAYPGRPG